MRAAIALFCLTCLPAAAHHASVTILATTDLHGNILPWNYLTGKPASRGLAKIASLIARERQSAPKAILLDAGDTIQGSPLETIWQGYVAERSLPLDLKWPAPEPSLDPMMAAMNHLGYDAMALGNHEFNYGLKNLRRARRDARFPWLSANTENAEASGDQAFQPFLVKTVDGVKVAIIGLTTPAIPQWEKPQNYKGYRFTDPIAATRNAIAALREKHKPDLIVVLAHTGLEREPSEENVVRRLVTEVPGIDAVIFGHSHAEVSELRIGNVLLTQPKNWGMSLARVDFELENTSGHWTVRSRNSRTIPVTPATPADPAVLKIAAPYHAVTEQWLSSVVTSSPGAMSASVSRIEDTAIIDAIQQVQLYYAKADVSFAAAFNFSATVPQGPVTVRQIAGLYVYDNDLYAIEGNGKMVREALENAARYFATCTSPKCHGPLVNPGFPGFNYDMAQGVSYEIDLSRPPGQRIQNLRFKGEPLADTKKLRIALNNYRAGGSGGYTMFANAPVVWRSSDDIRDLMIRYYSKRPLPAKPDANWRISPECALRELRAEMRAITRHSQNQ